MMARATKVALGFLAACVAGAAVIAVGLVVLFWSGPVSVGFLTPYVQDALDDAQGAVRVSIDDTILTWGGWDRGIDVRALNVRLSTRDGVTVADVPEVAVALSPQAMARGVVAPRRVDVFGPEVFVRRGLDGSMRFAFGPPGTDAESNAADAGAGEAVDRLLAALNGRSDPADPGSYLESVAVVGGAASLFDERTGRAWFAPVVNGSVTRGETGVGFEAALTVDLAGSETDIDVFGALDARARETQLAVRFADLVPARLADADPALAALSALDAPLSGTASVTLDDSGAPLRVRADLTAGAGTVAAPDPVGSDVSIAGARAVAAYDRAADLIRLDGVEVDFGTGNRLGIAAIDHAFPIRSAEMTARIRPQAQTATIDALTVDLGGPALTLTAAVSGLGSQAMRIEAALSGGGIAVEDLATYWPRALAEDANAWSVEHLVTGTIEDLAVDAVLTGDPAAGLEAEAVSGRMRGVGVTIDYLDGMPPVTGVDGDMTFDTKAFTVDVARGESAGLTVQGGTIVLSDLDTDVERASIRLDIEGPARNAVALIDNPVFAFAAAVGLSSERVRGDAVVDLSLSFPLKDDLDWDEVQVKARAAVADLGVQSAALGQDLSQATADLVVDNDGLNVKADGRFGRLPITVTWRENFSEPRAFKSRYDVQTVVRDVTTLADLGVDLGPVAADTLGGTVAADIVFTEREDGEAHLSVNADLENASLTVPAFEWRKAPGTDGRLTLTMEIRNGLIDIIPAFALSAPGLTVRGLASFADDGTGLEIVRLQQFTFGRTDVVGVIIPRDDGGWDMDFNGPALDLSSVWTRLTDDTAADAADPDAADPLLPDMTVSMRVDTVWLDEDRRIDGLSAALTRQRNTWRSMFVESTGDQDTRFTVRMAPDGDGNRVLDMRAENAGAVLRALGLYDSMIGGRLELSGTFDDSRPDTPLAGSLTVEDYRIVDLPWLAQVVNVMALTGIADSLAGPGISFSSLELPFVRTADTMTIQDGKAFGVSLGITVSGTLYFGAGALDLNGTIVPAYALNSMLGNVPLLGPLFTGGEEGGGVFAANYAVGGTREDPDVTVNPLSALAPGFLRNIFGVLDGTGGGAPPSDGGPPDDPFDNEGK
jgi:hypothetical protein